MIDPTAVQAALQAPDGWTDTPEQAQLRACLTQILSGHDAIDTIRICKDVVNVTRDQLLTGAASVRRAAAAEARKSMTPKEMSQASGETPQTISRLLAESKIG